MKKLFKKVICHLLRNHLYGIKQHITLKDDTDNPLKFRDCYHLKCDDCGHEVYKGMSKKEFDRFNDAVKDITLEDSDVMKNSNGMKSNG